MKVDYAAKEQEFLASLEADTGRDLAGWMAAISSAGLADRNAIIDWLRAKGFLFDRASWLERIHHNGGRPIYAPRGAGSLATSPVATGPIPTRPIATGPIATGPIVTGPTDTGPTDTGPTRPAIQPTLQSPATRAQPTMPPRLAIAAAQPDKKPTAPAPASASSSSTAAPAHAAAGEDVAALLAKGKAFRLLAEHILREARRLMPDLVTRPCGGLIGLAPTADAAPFALMAVSPRDVRLALDGRGADCAPPFLTGRLSGAEARFSHIAILTDARQVSPELLSQLCAAAERTVPVRSGPA